MNGKRLQEVANLLAADAPALAAALRPQTLNRSPCFHDFDVLRCIGEGGFGRVWLARNNFDKSLYAVKTIDSDVNVELAAIRLYRSVKEQPHLVRVLHVGCSDTTLYYVMPLADDITADITNNAPVEVTFSATSNATSPTIDHLNRHYHPCSLDAYVERFGKLDAQQAKILTHQMLSALAALHDAGIVHRDIKPDNILRFDGVWRLSDPGLIATLRTETKTVNRCADTTQTCDELPPSLRNVFLDLHALSLTLSALVEDHESNGDQRTAWLRNLPNICGDPQAVQLARCDA